MLRDKHKRKTKHLVLITSDATGDNARHMHIDSHKLVILIVILSVIIGSMAGYIIYEERIWQAVDARSDTQQKKIEQLTAENDVLKEEKVSLETEIDGLNEKVQILSDTVNQKTKNEEELQKQLDKQSMPTEFPLGGSATIVEEESEEPIVVFQASAGTMVIATANGTVTGVNDDVDYGHNIWIDHGNGYVTVYRNGGEPMVAQGDSVIVGTPLFTIERNKEKLGYQMMRNGSYIDPTELLAING